MLTNYDAKAVAKVMGLAFLRTATDGCVPSPGARDNDFIIYVLDCPMLMVEIKANKVLAEFTKSATVNDLYAKFEDHLVSSLTPIFIEKAVEKGLPRQALRHVAEWLAGEDRTKVPRLEWGVVPKTTLERRVTQLSPEESERTERIARLSVHAQRALGTEAEARAFMTTPHPELDGRSPVDAARTDLGTRRAEEILNALEYGLAL
jgi:putative toxin-antitoxin system antitoxin component (TIGR02293 family)